jgi:hypothetical protein
MSGCPLRILLCQHTTPACWHASVAAECRNTGRGAEDCWLECHNRSLITQHTASRHSRTVQHLRCCTSETCLQPGNQTHCKFCGYTTIL